MKERRLRGPIDMMVVTASFKAMGVRLRTDLDDVRSALAGWTPRAVMGALAQVLHHVRDAGVDPDAHRRFLPHLTDQARPHAERWLDDSDDNLRQVLLSEQYVAIAALFALERSDPAGRDDGGSLLNTLIAASLAVPDLIPMADPLLDISRLVLFAESQEWSDELTVARALVRLLCARHRTIDFDACCRAEFGVGLAEAWMMTAVFAEVGARLGYDQGLFPWRFASLPGGFDEEKLAAGRRLWIQTLDEAVERAGADVQRLGWSFRAFVERPITTDGNHHIVVWPRAFAEKAYPFGVIALAQRVAAAQGVTIESVREECADVLEELIGELLDGGYRHLDYVTTESQQRTQFAGCSYRNKQCDWLLIEDRFVVALEARHRPYSYKAQAAGDLSDLERDIELSIINKIEQCDAALANADHAGLLDTRTPIAIIVNSCPVPVSPLLMQHVERVVAARGIAPFRTRRNYTIAIVSAVHLHQLLRAVRRTGRSVGGQVERWRDHPQLGELSFYDWATQHCPTAIRNVEVDWMADAVKAVLGFDLRGNSMVTSGRAGRKA